MIDVTMTSMLTLCVAMILATMAFTAHEFRRLDCSAVCGLRI